MVQAKNLIQNLALVAFGFLLAILICEGLLRLIYQPVDYLRAEPTPNKILGHKLRPGQAGHDDWGFRNKDTLNKVHVLAIGDSQTYGVSAKSSDSWPSQLSRKGKIDVYNLSLGGYGPLEYLHLLEEYQSKIQFNHLVVGLYLGNDLVDAYRSAYSIDYNDSFRCYPFDSIERRGDSYAVYNMTEVKDRAFKGWRIWLANNSITYRMLTHSWLGDFVRREEMEENSNSCYAVIKSGKTFLTPALRISTINLAEPKVAEGWRITRNAILSLKETCLEKNASFTLLLIPTKELVYSNYEHNGECRQMAKLKTTSAAFRTELNDFLDDNGIKNLWAFSNYLITEESIYPEQDSHPNKYGYEIIAENVFNKIN